MGHDASCALGRGHHGAGEGGLLSLSAAPGTNLPPPRWPGCPQPRGPGRLGVPCAAMSLIQTEPQWLSEEDAPARAPQPVQAESPSPGNFVENSHSQPDGCSQHACACPDDTCVCSACMCVWKACAPGRAWETGRRWERPSVEPTASLPPTCPHSPLHLHKPGTLEAPWPPHTHTSHGLWRLR